MRASRQVRPIALLVVPVGLEDEALAVRTGNAYEFLQIEYYISVSLVQPVLVRILHPFNSNGYIRFSRVSETLSDSMEAIALSDGFKGMLKMTIPDLAFRLRIQVEVCDFQSRWRCPAQVGGRPQRDQLYDLTWID